MTYPADNFLDAVDLAVIGSNQLHEIINGDASTEITVEDGSKIPSLRKAYNDAIFFKSPIPWQSGSTETNFLQLRSFLESNGYMTWWFAKGATNSTAITMGSTPYNDPNWTLYNFSANSIYQIYKRLASDVGFVLKGTFYTGAVISTVSDVILDEKSGLIYSWGGTLPITVVAGDTPNTLGVSPTTWIDKTSITLRSYVDSQDANLQSQIGTLSSGLLTTNNNLQITNNAVAALDSELQIAQNNISSLQTGLQTANSDIDTLELNLATTNQNLTNLSNNTANSFTSVNNDIDTLETTVSSIQSTIGGFSADVALEALRRTYADAGYNLVSGSFENGGTLNNANDVLLVIDTGIAYSWGGSLPKVVAPGTDPTAIGSGYVAKNDSILRGQMSSDSGMELVRNKRTATAASINYALTEKADETRSAFEWNIRPSLSDATAEINAAILDIYKLKQNVLSDDEIYSVTLKFDQGVDYHILGTVIIPSGVILDFNGSRVVGPDGSAGTTAYIPSGSKMFITGRYESGSIVSNLDASSEAVKRVIGSGVRGATIGNSNCPFDLVNFQEMCFLDDLRFSNCSLMFRTKGSFYSRYGNSIRPLICRNTAQAAGQYAILLHGAAAHQLKFDCRLVDVRIGYEVTATNSFDVEINGSFEEGKASGSIGIRNNGAYCQSWRVNSYFEGVGIGITGINNGTFNASLFAPQYFSSCNYSFKAEKSTFRACRVMCSSIPDEGAGGHNTADFSAPNNDVIFDMGAKGSSTASGAKEYPTNILLGAGCKAQGTVYHYDDTSSVALTDALAYAQPANANPSRLNEFAFEGSHIVTKPNQMPFCSKSVAVNTLTIDTQLTHDESNILAFNFRGGTDSVTFVLSGFIFGTTVSWVEHNPAGVSLSVANNAGRVRLTFANLTAAVPTINVTGCVRHV